MDKLYLDIFRIEHQEETHQEPSLSKIFLLKCFTVFFILVSFYPFEAYSRYYKEKPKSSKSESTLKTEEIEEKTLQLKKDEKELSDFLIMRLDKSTSEEEIIEIIEELRDLPDNHQQMKIVLTYLSQKGIDREKSPKLWTIVQSEWIKIKKADLEELYRNANTLSTKSYEVILATLMIVSGLILLATPARGVVTNRFIASLVASLGAIELFRAVDDSLTEDKKEVFAFFFNLVTTNPLARELFSLAPTNEFDRQLAEKLAQSPTLEDLRRELVRSIGNDEYSVQQERVVALREFPDIEENLRKEAIESLKQIIDNNIEDKFSVADVKNESNELIVQSEISDSFIDSLLSTKEEERSKQHITVLKGLIRLEILGLELKLKFSETLLNWGDSAENNAFLIEFYLNPTEEIISYMEEELFKEGLSYDDYEALDFLKAELNILKKQSPLEILYKIELIIDKFKRNYSKQVEKTQKLENIVESYQKIVKSIQNAGFGVKNGLPYVEI